MNRSFIRKTKKKKHHASSPQKNPEERAKMNLIQISNQAHLREHTTASQDIQQFLKLESDHFTLAAEAKSQKIPKKSNKKSDKYLFLHTNFDSITKAFNILVQYKVKASPFFEEPSKKMNSAQIFISRKNPVNITNFMVIDDPNKQKKRINSAQNTLRKNKYPNSIRNLLRRKSANHDTRESGSVQSQRVLHRSLNSNRINFSTIYKQK